jgi:hydrogenase maturation protein HypF
MQVANVQSSTTNSLPLPIIHHHHAHMAACMAENGIPLDTAPVLGITLDSLSYGEDGLLWGDEFLLADYCHFQRVGTLNPVTLWGRDPASIQPWCSTYTHLVAAFDWEDLQAAYGELEFLQFLDRQPRAILNQLLLRRMYAPLVSSVDRLFDAVAATIGICRDRVTYRRQSAIELAALIETEHLNQAAQSAYRFEVKYLGQGKAALPYVEPRPMWHCLLEDLLQQVPTSLVAARFHLGLANAITQMVEHLRQRHAFTHVALTGGGFRHLILTQHITQQLTQRGFAVLTGRAMTSKQEGLSLGRATIAAARSVVANQVEGMKG